MSKKKRNPIEPVRAINAEVRTVKRERHEQRQKDQGVGVVKWICIGLLVLALAYMVWTMYLVA